MKFKLKGAIFAAVMFCMSIGTLLHAETMNLVYDGVAHTYDLQPINLYIDKKPIQTTIMPPIQLGARVLVPAREVFEPMGATVEWKAAENKVYVYDQSSLLVLDINGTDAFVNGQVKQLDMPAKVINDKLMIPIRFISEQLGFKVDWDNTTRSVFIEKMVSDPVSEQPIEEPTIPVPEPEPVQNWQNTLNHVEYDYNASTLILDKPKGIAAGDLSVEDLYRQRRLIVDLKGDYSQFFDGGNLSATQGRIKNVTVEHGSGTKLIIDTFTISAINIFEQDDKIHIQVVKPSDKYNQIVVLDAGHGGSDTGTSGGGLKEKDLNLKFTMDTYQLFLSNPDIKVYMTRETDVKPSLEERVKIANEVGADLFICIHNNYIDKQSVSGTETYYYANSPKGQYFAKLVQTGIVQTLGMKDRSAKADTGYYVIRNTTMPSVLIEVGFLSSAIDRQKLTQPDFSPQLADIIYNAALTYFSLYSR